ncbi:helix-turn-helix transcriptional regulator [Bacillus zhangzhouensis]|nr:helix-turn-helix transcriptional regulator [Bacillus zhangzhouensis]
MDNKKIELISINLKRLRNEQNPKLSIRKLAQEVGLSNGYLSKLESKKIKSPSLDALTKLADFFNVDPTYFVTDPKELEKMGKEAEKVVFAKELTLENIKNANIIDENGKQISDDERNFMLDALKNYRASKAKYLSENDSLEED